MLARVSSVAMLVLLLTEAAGCAQVAPTSLATMQATLAVGLTPTPEPAEEALLGSSSGIVEEMDLQHLIAAADFILVGSVGEVNSEWNAGRTRIYTHVKLSVDRCVKGTSRPREVTITFPGGQVEEIVQSVSVAPQFQVGEDAIVFLQYDEDGTLRVVGGFQGKFTLREDRIAETDVLLESFLSQIGQIMRETGISGGACTGD